jgi:uridylate kinase
MDGAAIAIARDNGLPVAVFSLKGEGAISELLEGGRDCTIVHAGGL